MEEETKNHFCHKCGNATFDDEECSLCCNGLVRDVPDLEGDPRLSNVDLNDPLDINLDIDDDDEPYFEPYPWED